MPFSHFFGYFNYFLARDTPNATRSLFTMFTFEFWKFSLHFHSYYETAPICGIAFSGKFLIWKIVSNYFFVFLDKFLSLPYISPLCCWVGTWWFWRNFCFWRQMARTHRWHTSCIFKVGLFLPNMGRVNFIWIKITFPRENLFCLILC